MKAATEAFPSRCEDVVEEKSERVLKITKSGRTRKSGLPLALFSTAKKETIMQAQDLMTRDVTTASPDETLQRVARRMAALDVGAYRNNPAGNQGWPLQAGFKPLSDEISPMPSTLLLTDFGVLPSGRIRKASQA